MRDFGKTPVDNPLLAAQLVTLVKSGRITKDLFTEALNSPKLALFVVRHETMHDIMSVLYMERQTE